jgi:hypothetical protein
MKMELTECSETSAHKIQTPGNYPEENIQEFDVFGSHAGCSMSRGGCRFVSFAVL